MDGRRSGPIDGMKWQVRCKQKSSGSCRSCLSVSSLAGVKVINHGLKCKHAVFFFFLGQIETQSDVSRSNREQRWKQRLTEPSR